ncbi:MAG: hypothetical protein QF706_12805, partial [Roseibacillus sp.]|nr:hypothetical protein [Roseibacillus sp.]
RNFDPGDEFGAAVCNPPYGLRSGAEFEITPLYQALGTFLRQHLPGRCAGIYTANHEAAPHFGGDLKASLPLLNGSLEGRLYRVAPDAPG